MQWVKTIFSLAELAAFTPAEAEGENGYDGVAARL
jgi:hypothetical protein